MSNHQQWQRAAAATRSDCAGRSDREAVFPSHRFGSNLTEDRRGDRTRGDDWWGASNINHRGCTVAVAHLVLCPSSFVPSPWRSTLPPLLPTHPPLSSHVPPRHLLQSVQQTGVQCAGAWCDGENRQYRTILNLCIHCAHPSIFFLMCALCRCAPFLECNKPTWAGCGQHIESALAGVPQAERCQCPRDATSGCTTQSQAAPQQSAQ